MRYVCSLRGSFLSGSIGLVVFSFGVVFFGLGGVTEKRRSGRVFGLVFLPWWPLCPPICPTLYSLFQPIFHVHGPYLRFIFLFGYMSSCFLWGSRGTSRK